MSKTIEGVPEFITRTDYLRLIESVGFSVNDLISLRFERDGIYAENIDRDPETGLPRISDAEVVRNTVYIPVKDEDGAA